MPRSFLFALPFILLAVPAALLAGLVLVVTAGIPVLLQSQPLYVGTQPVAFNHQVHVQVAGMECQFCHRTADRAATAGYPDVEQCMFCHSVVGAGNPEIEKVRNYWAQQQPINWTRIHRMPDHVKFVHQPHISANVDCATCHGDVGSMRLAEQVRVLNMGDCVACHRQFAASTECVACHY